MNLGNNPFPPGASVAAYLRDSGGDSQDLSIPQQESEIRTWCQSNNITLSNLFIDEATPGSSSVGRSGFLAMISYFTSSNLKPESSNLIHESGILVWKFSRFAREIDDAQYYKSDLRRRGYIIHSLNESIPQGLDGRLFEAAIDWMNARYLQDLSTDVKRGLQHNITQYGAIGGTPPRGFKRSDPITLGTRRDGKPHIVHRWEPDPELIPLIQHAFHLRALGTSYQEIAKETGLYKRKNSWNHFFSNQIYIGIMHFGNTVIDDYCQPIIDRTTWEKVQMINKNPLKQDRDDPNTLRNHPRAKSSDYILTGLLRCGMCGSPLTGETVHSRAKNHTNRYYACTTNKKTNGADCQAPWVPKEELERAILHQLVTCILSTKNLTALRDNLLEHQSETMAQITALLAELHKQRTQLKLQINRLTDAIADSGGSPAVIKKLNQREQEERELLANIENNQAQLQQLQNTLTNEQLNNLSETLTSTLKTADRKPLRRWLSELIDHIEVTRIDKKLTGVIYYYQPDELMSNGQSHRSRSIHTHKF